VLNIEQRIEEINLQIDELHQEFVKYKENQNASQMEKKELKKEIINYRKRYFSGKVFWYVLYYFCFPFTVILPVATAFVLKMNSITDDPVKIDLAAGLAIAGAVCIILFVKIKFKENILRYHLSLDKISRLDIERTNSNMSNDDIRLKLNEIVTYHNNYFKE
jgi:hypothetical protein